MDATMFPVKDVSTLDMAFPCNVRELMPKWEDIPKEFRDSNSRSQWNRFMSDWFYSGLESYDLKPRDGVDVAKALRHLRTILGSFEPKHEHKEAAVAYLASQWFLPESTWTVKARKLG